MRVCLQLAQHFGFGMDGERDVDGFLWKGRLVTHVILIQPSYDAIAVAGDVFVELPFGRSQPVFLFFDGVGIGSRFSADVEIAIAERFFMRAGVHPKPIHPHGTEDDAFVMATEVTIEGTQALCLELGKTGLMNCTMSKPRRRGKSEQIFAIRRKAAKREVPERAQSRSRG